MKSVTFTWKDDGNDWVYVHGEAECGRRFEVGRILEPHGPNPLLHVYKPLGMAGMRQILDAWEEHKPG